VLLAMCVALVPLPVAASDPAVEGKPAEPHAPAVSSKTRNLETSMARIVAHEIRSARPAVAPRAEQGTNPGAQSLAFFKTRTGALIVAVMIAGTGYALYSTQHDRIHSAGKQ
jgi:hypothetical protein